MNHAVRNLPFTRVVHRNENNVYRQEAWAFLDKGEQ